MYRPSRAVAPASSRYAADYGMPTWRPTQIQSYIDRCCDTAMEQLNLPLALELADYINTKRANTAREAAFEIVQRINARVPHVGMLALDLLDILVKNCGFLMHLQIATKEFLNELVRRFPERPPMHPGPVMTRILEMIHEWRQTICVTSKHKEDLVHIRDMHRLLMYKGYRFPKVDARSASVLSSTQPLQSPEELEEETRLAQSAKLQEYIRRGTPRDLHQAQELMKILSGAEPERDHVQTCQIIKEMDKIESRVKLLGDMLDQANPADKFVSGDAYDQVASSLQSIQPRLQRWIEQADDSEESQHLTRFLEVNDAIHQILQRYEAVSTGRQPAAAGSSLISLEDDDVAQVPPASQSHSLLDEFASLDMSQPAKPLAAPTAAPSSSQKKTASSDVFDLLGELDEHALPPPPPTSSRPSPAAHDPMAGVDLLS